MEKLYLSSSPHIHSGETTDKVNLRTDRLLVSAESQAPMSYGIYLFMQSVAGRGPGAALGVLAVVIVALGTYFSHRMADRTAGHSGKGAS